MLHHRLALAALIALPSLAWAQSESWMPDTSSLQFSRNTTNGPLEHTHHGLYDDDRRIDLFSDTVDKLLAAMDPAATGTLPATNSANLGINTAGQPFSFRYEKVNFDDWSRDFRVGWAGSEQIIIVEWTKQDGSEAKFFVTRRDGILRNAFYLENKQWRYVSNNIASPSFEMEKQWWQVWSKRKKGGVEGIPCNFEKYVGTCFRNEAGQDLYWIVKEKGAYGTFGPDIVGYPLLQEKQVHYDKVSAGANARGVFGGEPYVGLKVGPKPGTNPEYYGWDMGSDSEQPGGAYLYIPLWIEHTGAINKETLMIPYYTSGLKILDAYARLKRDYPSVDGLSNCYAHNTLGDLDYAQFDGAGGTRLKYIIRAILASDEFERAVAELPAGAQTFEQLPADYLHRLGVLSKAIDDELQVVNEAEKDDHPEGRR